MLIRRLSWRPVAAVSVTVALLGGCSAAPAQSLDPADCAGADASGLVSLTAEDEKFDSPCISVAPDAVFTIRLLNRDSDLHNVAVYDGQDKANEFLVGDTIGRDESIDYPVDAIPAGTYYYECNVHPVMHGPLFVVTP